MADWNLKKINNNLHSNNASVQVLHLLFLHDYTSVNSLDGQR